MTAKTFVSRCNARLSAHRQGIILFFIIVSVISRCIYFVQITDSPCALQHHWNQSDIHFFDQWARVIAGGDWLVGKPMHPYHNWHKRIAEQYFTLNPDKRFEYTGGRDEGIDPHRELWNQWYGGNQFHQEPLYPYLIAISYRILGERVEWIFVWQAIIGILNIAMIYHLTLKLFGDLAAVISTSIAVLYGPMLFYEMIPLRTTMITFFGLSLVILTLKALDKPGLKWWSIHGLVLGLAVTLKTTFYVYGVGVVALLLAKYWRVRGKFGRTLGVFVLGSFIGMAPAIVRNLIVHAPPLGFTSVNSIGIISFNAKHFDPQLNNPIHDDYIREIMTKTNGRFVPTAIETLKTHDSPWSVVALMSKKIIALWHWYEVPNNANFYYYRLHCGVLKALPFTFFLLAPISIIGIILGLSRRRDAAPLYILIGTLIVALLVSTSFSRYRLPLVVALMPLSGFTIATVIEWLTEGRRKSRYNCLILCGAFLIISWWTMRPVTAGKQLIRYADILGSYEWYHDNPDYAGAKKYLNQVLEVLPDQIDVIMKMANLELRYDHFEDARSYYQKVLGLDPKHIGASKNLGVCDYRLKRVDKAVIGYEKLVEIYPNDIEIYVNLMAFYLELNDLHGAWSWAEKSLERFPDNPSVRGNAMIIRGKLEELETE